MPLRPVEDCSFVVFIGVAVWVSTQDTVLGVMSVVHPEDGHGWTTGGERFYLDHPTECD